MCFSWAGARTAERRGPGKAGAERQVVLAPSHWLFRKQRRKKKWKPEQSLGKARRGRVPRSPGMGGRRWRRRLEQDGEARSAIRERRDGGLGSEAHKASRRRGAVPTCAPSAPAGAALSSSSIWLSCATAATGGDLDVSLWTIGKKSTPRLRIPSSTPRVPCSSSSQDRRLSGRGTSLEHVAKPRGDGAGTRLGGRGKGRPLFGASGPGERPRLGLRGRRAGSREGPRQEEGAPGARARGRRVGKRE